MLLTVFDKTNFTAFFRCKIWDWNVNKNDLNFSKQYFKKIRLRKKYK